MKNVVFLVDHPSTQDDLLTSVIEAKLGVQCSIQPLSQMTWCAASLGLQAGEG